MHISTVDCAVLAGTIALGLTFAASQASAWPATAETCHDGDTCTVVTNSGQRLHIRLAGIDAPELDQPFGTEAQALVTRIVVGRQVDVRPTGYSYSRVIANLVLPDGKSVGDLLVAAGAAWVEPRWNTNPQAPSFQDAAQRAHLGLWANAEAVPPWEWRHTHGVGHTQAFTPPSGWAEHFRWTHSPDWSRPR